MEVGLFGMSSLWPDRAGVDIGQCIEPLVGVKRWAGLASKIRGACARAGMPMPRSSSSWGQHHREIGLWKLGKGDSGLGHPSLNKDLEGSSEALQSMRGRDSWQEPGHHSARVVLCGLQWHSAALFTPVTVWTP